MLNICSAYESSLLCMLHATEFKVRLHKEASKTLHCLTLKIGRPPGKNVLCCIILTAFIRITYANVNLASYPYNTTSGSRLVYNWKIGVINMYQHASLNTKAPDISCFNFQVFKCTGIQHVDPTPLTMTKTRSPQQIRLGHIKDIKTKIVHMQRKKV